jgi:hypothetical protein
MLRQFALEYMGARMETLGIQGRDDPEQALTYFMDRMERAWRPPELQSTLSKPQLTGPFRTKAGLSFAFRPKDVEEYQAAVRTLVTREGGFVHRKVSAGLKELHEGHVIPWRIHLTSEPHEWVCLYHALLGAEQSVVYGQEPKLLGFQLVQQQPGPYSFILARPAYNHYVLLDLDRSTVR